MSFGFNTGRRAGVASCASLTLLLGLSACGGGGGGSATPSPAGDTTPPDTSITSGPESLTNQSTASFAFSSSEAGSTFEVSVDGGAFTAATSPHSLTGVALGAHTFSVRARDAAGNTDASPATLAWNVAIAPDTTIVTRPPALTTSTTASFAFSSATASVTYAYSLDGGAFIASGETIQLTGLSAGAHQLSARAVIGGTLVDASPATVSWTIDTTPAIATIVFPAPTSYTDANTITVRGSASDANGIANLSVNGVAAQSANSFNTWSATIPVSAGHTTITVSATDAAGNVAASADTATITNNGPPFLALRAADIDVTNNRLIAGDEVLGAIVAIDLSSGATSIISDRTHGTGTNFESVESIALDGTRALVLDWYGDRLFSVDLTTGNRTSYSAGGVAATAFSFGGIAVDSVNHVAYVTNADSGTVISVDLATGARSVVSSGSVGTGSPLGQPLDIVYDTSTSPARLLVLDGGIFNVTLPSIIAVTIGDGSRATVSSSGLGTGPLPVTPMRMKLDASHSRLLLTDAETAPNGVLAVNLANGNRTVVVGPGAGTGPSVSFPRAIAVNAAGTRAYVSSNTAAEVIAVDLQTLNRTVHSNTSVGNGSKQLDVRGLELTGSSLMFVDIGFGTVNRVDLNTGDRSIVSGDGIGSGPALGGPRDQVFDARNQRMYVAGRSSDLVSLDATTGARTSISSSFVGSGPTFRTHSMILDDTRVLISDSTLRGIVSVNLSTGIRTVVSAPDGAGPNFDSPAGLAMDRQNPLAPRLLVANTQTMSAPSGIWSVNLSNGTRTLFSTQSPIGEGVPFIRPIDIEYDPSGPRLLALDGRHQSLMSVSLANGNRQILSGRNSIDESVIGKGPRFALPWSLITDSANGIVYVGDTFMQAIFAIDLATGDRIIVSR